MEVMKRKRCVIASFFPFGFLIWWMCTYSRDGSLGSYLNLSTNRRDDFVNNVSKHANRRHLLSEDRHHKLSSNFTQTHPKNDGRQVVPNKEKRKEDFTAFYITANKTSFSDPLLHLHRYSFLINSKNLCKLRQNVLYVTYVHSAPSNFAKRDLIRRTWAKVSTFHGFSLPVVFILGKIESLSIQKRIKEESLTHGDIVQGNFEDTYRNLTYKNILGLHWVLHHCDEAHFILKIDDDVLVNPYHVTDFLSTKPEQGTRKLFIMCSVFSGQGPVRDPRDKWYMPREEYPYDTFPNYCEGFAYVLSMHTARELYRTTAKVPFFWVDDVYTTGFLPHVARIRHTSFNRDHDSVMMKGEYSRSELKTAMVYLAKRDSGLKYWNSTWNKIQHTMTDKTKMESV